MTATVLQSMTGFGRSMQETNQYKVTFELKSLNGKYFDLELRIPKYLMELDPFLRKSIADHLERGSVFASVQVEEKTISADQNNNILNATLLQKYHQDFKLVSQQMGLQYPGNLENLLMLPDVLKSPDKQLDEELKNVLETCCDLACQHIKEFRQTEGSEMAKGLTKNIDTISNLRLRVLDLEPKRKQQLRDKITSSVEEHIQQNLVDKNRLEQEILLYLEKWDIGEELQRLGQHLQYFSDCMKKEPKGKKLNFIAQEIGREINTLGVKSNYFEMQQCVVEMKEELEKIKEQVLNIL